MTRRDLTAALTVERHTPPPRERTRTAQLEADLTTVIALLASAMRDDHRRRNHR